MGMQAAGRVMSDINITPLVDVMLVLLIIFMVAAPVMEKERSRRELDENRDKQQRLVALNLPALDNAGMVPNAERVLTLKVSASLVVSFECSVISDCSGHPQSEDKCAWVSCFDEVERAVRERAEAFEGGIVVDAEPHVKFGFVVGIMHRLYKAGIEKVSMFPQSST